MYKPNTGKLNCLPRKHTVLIPKGIRRHGSCLEGQRPSCWAFTVNPVGTFIKDQPRKLKKKCLQKLHLGKSQQQFGTHPQGRTLPLAASAYLLPHWCLQNNALAFTPPDVWSQVMPGVFAVQFVQDTTTTLILTQHFLSAVFLSRLTSSTVPLNMVEQPICFAMNQQIDCFCSIFLNLPTLLCLASLFCRREKTRNNLAVIITILFTLGGRWCLEEHAVVPAPSQVLHLNNWLFQEVCSGSEMCQCLCFCPSPKQLNQPNSFKQIVGQVS